MVPLTGAPRKIRDALKSAAPAFASSPAKHHELRSIAVSTVPPSTPVVPLTGAPPPVKGDALLGATRPSFALSGAAHLAT